MGNILVVKLGAQYHMGLVLLQFLAKNIWDPKDVGDTDTEVVSVITAIPTRSVWRCGGGFPTCTGDDALVVTQIQIEGAALWRATAQSLP